MIGWKMKFEFSKRNKKYIVIILALVLVIFLSVLGTKRYIGNQNEEIVLEFGMFTESNWGVESADTFVIIDEAIARFESEHPGVKIHYYSGVLKDDYSEWLSRKLLKGEAPDVFMVLSDDFNQFCSMGVLKNLEDVIEKDEEFDTEKYFSTAMACGQYENSQYALPYEVVPTLIFVNKTLLNQENVAMPDEDWTWDDFYEICKAVTKDTDGDGTIDQFGTYDYDWLDAAYSNNGNPFTIDGNSVDFTSTELEAAVRFIRNINNLYEGRQVTMEDFDAGNVAFMPVNFAEYRTYKTYPYRIKKYRNFSWDCITFPAGSDGGNTSVVDALLMGINEKTKHEDLAWEFLKLLTYDEEMQMDIFRYSQGASVLKSVTSSEEAEAIQQEDMERGEQVIDSAILSRIIEEGEIAPRFQKYEQALTLSDTAINKMLEEDGDIESTLKILQKDITSYLKQ